MHGLFLCPPLFIGGHMGKAHHGNMMPIMPIKSYFAIKKAIMKEKEAYTNGKCFYRSGYGTDKETPDVHNDD